MLNGLKLKKSNKAVSDNGDLLFRWVFLDQFRLACFLHVLLLLFKWIDKDGKNVLFSMNSFIMGVAYERIEK